jgi:hypothetical protein
MIENVQLDSAAISQFLILKISLSRGFVLRVGGGIEVVSASKSFNR